jgi:hypothetical protein
LTTSLLLSYFFCCPLILVEFFVGGYDLHHEVAYTFPQESPRLYYTFYDFLVRMAH